MKECKYRLPCNWCDKFNKLCDMEESIEIELPSQDNCAHYWMYDKRTQTTAGINYYYHCVKCGATKLETYDYNGNRTCCYESGEWRP